MTSVIHHKARRLATATLLGGLSLFALSPSAGASALAPADNSLCVEKQPQIVDYPDREIGSYEDAAVSDSGAVVVFSSSAQTVGRIGRQRGVQIYARHRDTGRIELVSRASGEHGARGSGSSSEPAISGDGRFVAFSSVAGNLVNGDQNRAQDVFVRDLLLDRTILVSSKKGRPDSPANGASRSPALTGDGSTVAFSTHAADVYEAAKSAKPISQVVAVNLSSQIRTLVSREIGGNAPGNRDSLAPSISKDGARVAFESFATNLAVGGGDGSTSNVFVFDAQSQSLTRPSWSPNTSMPGSFSGPAISADGTHVAFANRYPAGVYIAPISGPATLVSPENTSFGFAGSIHRLMTSNDGASVLGLAVLGDAWGLSTFRFGPGMKPELVSAGRRVWASSDFTTMVSSHDVDGRYGIFDGPAAATPFAWLADRRPTLSIGRAIVKGNTVRLKGRSSYAHSLFFSVGLMTGAGKIRWLDPSGHFYSRRPFCPGDPAPNWSKAPAKRRWAKSLRASSPLPPGTWVALVRAWSDRGTDVSASDYAATKFRVR